MNITMATIVWIFSKSDIWILIKYYPNLIIMLVGSQLNIIQIIKLNEYHQTFEASKNEIPFNLHLRSILSKFPTQLRFLCTEWNLRINSIFEIGSGFVPLPPHPSFFPTLPSSSNQSWTRFAYESSLTSRLEPRREEIWTLPKVLKRGEATLSHPK